MILLTDSQVDALLYGETSLDFDGVSINSWHDCEDGCKNIDLVWQTPHREVSFFCKRNERPGIQEKD